MKDRDSQRRGKIVMSKGVDRSRYIRKCKHRDCSRSIFSKELENFVKGIILIMIFEQSLREFEIILNYAVHV